MSNEMSNESYSQEPEHEGFDPNQGEESYSQEPEHEGFDPNQGEFLADLETWLKSDAGTQAHALAEVAIATKGRFALKKHDVIELRRHRTKKDIAKDRIGVEMIVTNAGLCLCRGVLCYCPCPLPGSPLYKVITELT